MPDIIKRGYITYYIYAKRIVVGINDSQFVSYDPYNNTNREGITTMKRIIENSKEDEYANVVDQMSLAVRCEIKGASTRKPVL